MATMNEFIDDLKSKNIRRVRIEMNFDENVSRNQTGDVLTISVPRDRYTKMLFQAEEINSKLEQIYTNKVNEKDNSIVEEDRDIKEERAKKRKRTIKGPKLLDKGKRFIAGLILASLTITGGTVAAVKTNDYKQEQASRILSVVKDELDADYIYDNSSSTGSNSSVIEIVAERDGKEYKYVAYTQDGKISSVVRNELSEEAVNAIQIAANAQDGNIFDAIKADKYADKIESGEIQLDELGQNISSDKDRDDER